MLDTVVSWLIDIGMAVGPILGYVSQYRLIRMTKQVGSFSIDICGILLFANILRLNFYIFKQYETALVFQSLFMISMQIVLLRQCTKYPQKSQQKNEAPQESEPALSPSRLECQQVQKFWRWNGFERYGVTILFFIFCTFLLSILIKLTPAAKGYGQLVGLVALMSQSILIAPQIAKNCQMQSTKGLSHMLVSFNLSGDIFKLIYFLLNNQPFQFILCGIIQVILDSFVIIQIFYYNYKQNKIRKNNKNQPVAPRKLEKIKQQKEAPESDINLNYEVKDLETDQNRKGDNLQQNQIELKQTKVQKKKSKRQQSSKTQQKNQKQYYSLNQQIQNESDGEEDNEKQNEQAAYQARSRIGKKGFTQKNLQQIEVKKASSVKSDTRESDSNKKNNEDDNKDIDQST